MYRTHTCGELRLADAGKEVTLAGWVKRTRDKGSLVWIDLRDRYGITQLFLDGSSDPKLLEQARSFGREFVIQAKGTVIERESKNPNMPTGEIELKVSEFKLLNSSKTPPFTIEDVSDGGDDLRMKYRYLDIRRNPVRQNLELRHRMAMLVRNYLSNLNFLEIETPMLIKSTPEGTGLFDEFRVAAAIQKELGNAITVAEVNPNERAFVAGALHPAGQCHFLASVGKTKFATGMCSVHISRFKDSKI